MKRKGVLSLVEDEIRRQPVELSRLLSSRLERAADSSVLVGAGDSYAASLAAFYLSSGRVLAFDPYVMSQSPHAARGKDVYFISVSGRTRSNIEAARRARGYCNRRIAITSNPQSPIAKEVEKVIEIPYTPSGRTSGTLSFSMSLLIALKLAIGRFDCNFRRAYATAKKSSSALVTSDSGITYFLGNNADHAVSLYATAKVYELLGRRAHPELLEEFSHMEVFSLTPSDAINIFTGFDSLRIGARLKNALKKQNYSCRLLSSWGTNPTEVLFHSVFLAQIGILKEAKREELLDPYFIHARGLLELSDEMIY